jgi:hypothetical protein
MMDSGVVNTEGAVAADVTPRGRRRTEGPVAALARLLAALPAEERRHGSARVLVRSGRVAVPPALARAIVAEKSALTRAIDPRHVVALRAAMAEGRWLADASVVQLHYADEPREHLFVVDGAHRLAAIAGGKAPVEVAIVARRFAGADLAADMASYDAANAQKAQSLAARAKTIARRTAPPDWAEAEKTDKAAVKGATRYGLLVVAKYDFAAKTTARTLAMAKVMDAAYAGFPATRELTRLLGDKVGPVPALLASESVLAFLTLATLEGLDAEGFVAAALQPGAIQRELAKVAGRKGLARAIDQVQAVAAALLWRAGMSETDVLRAVYQDRAAKVGGMLVKF